MRLSPAAALLLLVALGGAYVITGYAYLLPQAVPTGRTFDALWFGVDGTERTVFLVSMTVAAFAFLVLSGRLASRVTWPTFPPLCVAYSVFLGGAMLWTTSLWWWSFDAYQWLARASVVAALCLTTLGAGLLVREAWTRHDVVATVAAVLVLAHVGVLDNGRWAAGFWANTRGH